MLRRVLFLVVLGMLLTSTAVFGSTSAPFSVHYTVEGLASDPIELVKADPLAAGITALDLTRGPGVATAGLTNGYSAQGWDSAKTREGALSAGAYFQLGFKVEPGYTASLSTMDMSLRRSATNGPMFFELWASLDGFATPGTLVSEFKYLGRTSGSAPATDPLLENAYYYMENDLPGRANTTTTPGDPIRTMDLAKVAQLQNIPEGTVVTFRLYAWGNDKTTATNTVAFGRMVGPKLDGVVSAK
jgi:hypothetical protein